MHDSKKLAPIGSVGSILLSLAIVFAVSQVVSLLSNDEEPTLVYGDLYGEFLDDYQGVLAIAHNSGNRVATGRASTDYQADVIEVDVRLVNGRLRAAHNAPAPYLGSLVSRAPSLATVWPIASGANYVQLDLKDNSDEFLDKLFQFLHVRDRDGTRIIFSSRSERTLQRTRSEFPQDLHFLSISTESRLKLVLEDEDLLSLIDGVTVWAGALTEEYASQLDDQEIATFAWVVNDLPTLNDMIYWGVDGIITDNLAIIELLAAHNADREDPPDDSQAGLNTREIIQA